MKQIIYSVRDRYVGFGTPLFLSADGLPDEVAKRMVKESLAGQDPARIRVKLQDLELCRLGIWDTVTGVFESEPTAELIATADSLYVEPKLTALPADLFGNLKEDEDEVY